jgi:putative spermidine/putrescine transport system substrate-binding protein
MALVVAGGLGLLACTGADAASPLPGREALLTSTPVPSPSTSPTPTADASPGPSIGAGEGTLTVLGYRGYVEYGGQDSKVNWVGPFERETGCKVATLDQVRDPAGLEDAYGKKAYDVVAASPETAGKLIAEGKVRELDTALVGDYDEIPKRLRNLPAYHRDGKAYGVPFLWQATQLLYDSRGAKPTSRQDLYTGTRAAIEDNPLSIAQAALVLRKSEPDLDIDDPFQLTPEQLNKALALLGEQRQDAGRVYWRDPLDVVAGFADGSLRLAQATPYVLDLLRRGGRPVEAAEEGPATGRSDAWMISANAAHPNCAYRWLDWMASADVQRQAAAWTGDAPANPGACVGRAARVCDAYHVGDSEWLGKVLFAVRPSRDCDGADGECTDYTEWVTRWRELVS